MYKTILFCLFAVNLTAQPVFQKKIEGLHTAEGLALLPDGGLVFAGLSSNCIKMVRLDKDGETVWIRQICPADSELDLSIRALQIKPDPLLPGGFLLLFNKGAFTSAPDNLLNVMKFDPSGQLVWDRQLWPEKRYGDFAPGSQLALTPSGAIWATHAMGLTDALPYFSQALVFKVNAVGQAVLRKFYLADVSAISNGIVAKSDQEVWVYGALSNTTADGFLLKINEVGDLIWSRKYTGIQFLKDGGFFSNGDALFLVEHQNAYALVRIAPDGNIVWVSKFNNAPNIFHFAVSPDDGIVLAGDKPNTAAQLFKINSGTGPAVWSKSYENCTHFRINALEIASDGNLFFTQSDVLGAPQSRLLKTDPEGFLLAGCSVFEAQIPILETISVTVSPFQFTAQNVSNDKEEHIFTLSDDALAIQDCCPSTLPSPKFVPPDSACINTPIALFSMGDFCSGDIQWTLPGAMPETAQGSDIQNIVWPTPGTYNLELTHTLGTCKVSVSKPIRVISASETSLFSEKDTLFCPDKPFLLEPNLSGYDSWIWSNGSTQSFLMLDPPTAGPITLRADAGICSKIDTFLLEIGGCGPAKVFIPNAFSPNDDGDNDAWEIGLQVGTKPINCQVFDRWGNLCYRTNAGELPRWDGTLNQRKCASGVYFWQFQFENPEGKKEYLKGDLLLVD